VEGILSLKACTACKLVKYCNAKCQRNHWPKHKKICKLRAAELHDEALFKDPPPKEDCPICFLPMPFQLICCFSLPPATITSVPINDYVRQMRSWQIGVRQITIYSCCGKSICGGCVHSFIKSGNSGKCPFCNCNRLFKTDEENIEDMMKRIEANDAGAVTALADCYYNGKLGLLRDQTKGRELLTRVADLGHGQAHCH
jgi:hypothetical protein